MHVTARARMRGLLVSLGLAAIPHTQGFLWAPLKAPSRGTQAQCWTRGEAVGLFWSECPGCEAVC
jgi:hypothetical protein